MRGRRGRYSDDPGYKEKFVSTGARISKMLIMCHHEVKWYSLLRTLLHNWSIGFLWPLVAQLRVFILPPIFVSQNHKNIAPPFLPSCYSTQGSPCHMKSASPFQPPLADSFWFSFLRFFSLWSIFKSSLNLLQYCFSVLCLGVFSACGILAPWPGIELTPPALKDKVFTMMPPGKSQVESFDRLSHHQLQPPPNSLPWITEVGKLQGTFLRLLAAEIPHLSWFHLKDMKTPVPTMRCQRNPRRPGLLVGMVVGNLGCFRGAQQRLQGQFFLSPVSRDCCCSGAGSCGRPSRSQLPILQIWFSGCAEDLVLLFFFFFKSPFSQPS